MESGINEIIQFRKQFKNYAIEICHNDGNMKLKLKRSKTLWFDEKSFCKKIFEFIPYRSHKFFTNFTEKKCKPFYVWQGSFEM